MKMLNLIKDGRNLKFRVTAASLHFLISLGIAFFAAFVVFGLWYPTPYDALSGGRDLFWMVVVIDVILGPFITFLIFSKNKRRRELILDLTVVAIIQFGALGYGLWTVFVARPVYLVFEYSRFSVVHAVDINPKQLASAPEDLRKLPLKGPQLIALRPFKDANEQFDATVSALDGTPLPARCELWQSYALAVTQVLEVAKPAVELPVRFPQHAQAVAHAIKEAGRPLQELRYLPVLGRSSDAWTVLLDATNAVPLAYLPLDSF
jgi:hypothetical protein